jgi:hypothetical protein
MEADECSFFHGCMIVKCAAFVLFHGIVVTSEVCCRPREHDLSRKQVAVIATSSHRGKSEAKFCHPALTPPVTPYPTTPRFPSLFFIVRTHHSFVGVVEPALLRCSALTVVVMAVPPSKQKQLSADYKPSRLRQQVNLESTDDERAPESHSIQSPDSQIAVPETQLERSEDIRTDEQATLSPKTAAILKRTTVRKGTESAEPIEFFTGQFFSRPPTSGKSSLTPEPAVRFTFGQPPNAAKKPVSNAERMVAHLDVESPHTQHEAGRKWHYPCSWFKLMAPQKVLKPLRLPLTCWI